MKGWHFLLLLALLGHREIRGDEETELDFAEPDDDVLGDETVVPEPSPPVVWSNPWKVDRLHATILEKGKELNPFLVLLKDLNLKNLNDAISLTNNILTRLISKGKASKEGNLVVSKGMEEVRKAFNIFSEPLMLPEDLKHFIDSIFGLGRNVDLTVALSGRWIKDFSESLEKVTQYTESDDEYAPSNMYVINLFDLTKNLKNKLPYTNFLDFFDQKWMHSILSRFSEFVENLSQLVEGGNISDAKQFIDGSNVVDDLQLIRDYTRERAVDILPGSVAKAIKAYKNQLLEVTWNQHFLNVKHPFEERPKNPQVLLLQLIQKRSDLSNTLQAFQAFVLEKFSDTYKYFESLNGKVEDLLSSMVPLPIGEGNHEKSLWEIIGQESSKVSAAQNLILQISQICAEFPIEVWNEQMCKSFAHVLSDKMFNNYSTIPRAMQQYFEVRGPYPDHASPNMIPRKSMTDDSEPILRVPNMFPLLAAATSNAVDALVDSTQIVADSMIHTAADITDRLRGSNSILARPFPVPPPGFRTPLILFEK